MRTRWLRLKAKVRMLKARILRYIDLRISKLYRIWWGYSDVGGGDRREIGRVLSKSEDLVFDFIKNVLMAEEYRESDRTTEEEFGFLMDIPPECKDCTAKGVDCHPEVELSEECGSTEYFEIERIPNVAEDRQFRLFTGENEYWDLTLLSKAERKILKESPHKWGFASQMCKAKDISGWPTVSRLIDMFDKQR